MSKELSQGVLVACLVAAFFPTVVALVRGARDNHTGGIVLLNLLHAAASGASSLLGLAALAILPFSGLVFFALMAWAFIAPGRVADREERQRHHELLAALRGPQAAAASDGKSAYWDAVESYKARRAPQIDRASDGRFR